MKNIRLITKIIRYFTTLTAGFLFAGIAWVSMVSTLEPIKVSRMWIRSVNPLPKMTMPRAPKKTRRNPEI